MKYKVVNLRNANLRGADLSGEDLSSVDLSNAVLDTANLNYANLTGANLIETRLNGASLSSASLRGADLSNAELENAKLNGVDLSDAILNRAVLRRAVLYQARLNSAILNEAKLDGADLEDADMAGAVLYKADLKGAIFEPSSIPEPRKIAAARNLEFVTYNENPHALTQLRKEFRDGGFREEERKVTYALKRREAERDLSAGNYGTYLFEYIFFDFACRYVMEPSRSLRLGFYLFVLSWGAYFLSIRWASSPFLDRVEPRDDGTVKRTAILPRRLGPALWTSFFFSLLNTFNIGFREINPGQWLRLLTRTEYEIKSHGGIRVVAGLQSIISMYLITLWLLSYFGRPFE